MIDRKTKAIILNSPSNPSGVIYSDEWMEEFSKIMKSSLNTVIISDEIYRDLFTMTQSLDIFITLNQELLKEQSL